MPGKARRGSGSKYYNGNFVTGTDVGGSSLEEATDMGEYAENLLTSLVNDEEINTFDAIAKVNSAKNKGKITNKEYTLILSNLGLL